MTMVVKLFGRDVAKNFLTMATFCDGEAPLLSQALNESPSFNNIRKV